MIKDRNHKGQFLKGTVPNPTGRPKKKPNYFLTAIGKIEEQIIEHYIKRAFLNDQVLIDLIRRILNADSNHNKN